MQKVVVLEKEIGTSPSPTLRPVSFIYGRTRVLCAENTAANIAHRLSDFKDRPSFKIAGTLFVRHAP